MRSNNNKDIGAIFRNVLLTILSVLQLVICFKVDGGQSREVLTKLFERPAAAAKPQTVSVTPSPVTTQTPMSTNKPEEISAPKETPAPDYTRSIEISELAAKNRAFLMLSDSSFPDWIEFHNITDSSIALDGWTVSDGSGETILDGAVIEAGGYLLIYADGRGAADAYGIHCGFSLSEGETVTLSDNTGKEICSAQCIYAEPDCSQSLNSDGEYVNCAFPTPGFENSGAGYEAYQNSLSTDSPLIIYEAATSNIKEIYAGNIGGSDWVEIRNVSDETVSLSDWYLSDDSSNFLKWQFPDAELKPGEILLVACDKAANVSPYAVCCGFALNAESESLYLSTAEQVVDHAALHDIPYGGSYGRVLGTNGWFYFTSPTPGKTNSDGTRRVSASPAALSEDGVFNDVDSVPVSFKAEGVIYYTTDGSAPTENSRVYTEPFTVSETCVVRAAALEEGALMSSVTTQSFIINEYHSLPVLSLATDSPSSYQSMYRNSNKSVEVRGNLAFYEDGGSFSIPCGVKMSGFTSLELNKKNLDFRFRGAYGSSKLTYDLFGTGETEFSSLTVRAGQDYYRAIIRNELCQTLCLRDSSSVLSQHTRFCILYVNGEYKGLFALKEKINEQLCADFEGVSKDSVTMITAPDWGGEFYYDVYYLISGGMADPEKYERFCSVMDVDSLIDWIIFEGWSANQDIQSGNLRYWKSSEGDGKWRLVFYDLDASLTHANLGYFNIMSANSAERQQIAQIIRALLANSDFKVRLLGRFRECINSSLSTENVMAVIEDMENQILPDVYRDLDYWGRDHSSWESNMQYLKDFIETYDYRQTVINAMCRVLGLSDEEKAAAFSETAVG